MNQMVRTRHEIYIIPETVSKKGKGKRKLKEGNWEFPEEAIFYRENSSPNFEVSIPQHEEYYIQDEDEQEFRRFIEQPISSLNPGDYAIVQHDQKYYVALVKNKMESSITMKFLRRDLEFKSVAVNMKFVYPAFDDIIEYNIGNSGGVPMDFKAKVLDYQFTRRGGILINSTIMTLYNLN